MSAVLAQVPTDPPPPANEDPAPALPMPKHFRKKAMKAAWLDLLESTEPMLHVKQNRFLFEMAATLMAKFRGGVPMTATESKELKRLMVTLGLAQPDDNGRGKQKRGKNDDYFE